MIVNKSQLRFFYLLPFIFVTIKSTTFPSESDNQCRLEVRCDGNEPSTSFPIHHDNRPLGIGKAGPKGQPGEKGEPGTSCTAQDCLAKTAEFEKLFLHLTSCLVEEIENTNHNASSFIRHNDTVTYECVAGYFTESIKTRRCYFGRLVPSFALSPFVCQQGCLVTSIKHTFSSAPEGTYVKSNSSIVYSCDAGYTTSNVAERTCNGSTITPSFEEEPLVCHADCTTVSHNFDRGTVQLPLVHGEKAVITCDTGYVLSNVSSIYCQDGLVDLSNVVCKKPTYHFVNKQLSWLKSQEYCVEVFQGNLASNGLETVAARKKLAAQFSMKNMDYTIGIRRVDGQWIRVDGSQVIPPLEFVWYPCCGNGSSNRNYMRVRSHPTQYPERIGMVWDHNEDTVREFVCEN